MREMKNSGIEWIGNIPTNWELIRTKNRFQWHKDIVGDKADEYERLALTLQGVIKRSKEDNTGLQPEAFVGYQILRAGELVFKLIDLENVSTSRVGLSPYTGIVSPAYIVLTPRGGINPTYAQYFFLSMWQREVFNHMGDDGVRSSLNAKDLLNVPMPCPCEKEQARIADFLDQKCVEIDSVIAETQRTIEEYKKLKQSIITEAVTKGVRGSKPMKDSGIEWIGEIPADWEDRPIKNSFFVVSGATPKSDNSDYWDGDIFWITPADYKFEDKYVDAGKRNLSQAGYDACGTTLVPAGSIIFSKRAPIGTVAIAGTEICTNQGCLSCIPKEGVCSMFFYYAMAAFTEQFNLYGTGTTFKEISFTAFSDFKLPLPPYEEQEEIALWLEEKCDEVEKLITNKQNLLAELESYKKSIIYEYVTGKKEVPACQ